MAHSHGHGHAHAHEHSHDVKNIKTAFFLNLLFTIIEIIGGFYTNSISILSDALHDLGDSFSLGIAWYFQILSKQKSTPQFTYGYKRFSLLGAIINALILTLGSVFVISETIQRLLKPEETNAKGMIFLAILGVIFNGAAVLKLEKGTSLNERVVSLHLLEDVLGWVAVLLGGLVMYFFDLPIIDPILSLLISSYVIYNAAINLYKSLRIVLQSVPENVDYQKVATYFNSQTNILKFHDLHIWSMDGEYNVLSVHLVKKAENSILNDMEFKNNLRHELHHLGIEHATIELENEGEICGVNCD